MTTITNKLTSALSLVTSFSNFDAYGRAGKVTLPTGMTREFTYDPLGNVLSATETVDGQARVTQYEYTHAGDLAKVTLSDGSNFTLTYDASRNLKKVLQDDNDTDPEDVHWQHFYRDVASNITGTHIYERNLGFVFNSPCFPVGPWCWTVEWTDVLKYKKNFDFDSLDRLVKVNDYQFLDLEANIVEYGYDKTDRVTSIKDSYGRTTSISRDSNSQIDTTTYRDGGISDVDYDANGNISGIKDALGQWTYYHRDGFGQAWAVISTATDLPTYYEFDAAGNLTKKTDARQTELNYEYDALNRLESVTVGSSSTPLQSFEYDTDQPGYLYEAIDEAGAHTFTRNQNGQVLTRTDTLNGQSLILTNTYDVHGRIDTVTYPSGLAVAYVYDSFGDVEKVTASGAGLSQSDVVKEVLHYPMGPIASFKYGNDELRSYTRHPSYEHMIIGSGAHFSTTAERDLNGNITDWDGRTFSYDEMDRLIAHTGPDGSWEYDYDLNGNRTLHKEDSLQTNYAYNSAGTRLNSLSGGTVQTRSYDANGNTTQIDNRYFDHDALNRFWRYREGALTVEYKHDSFGARAVKADGTATTRFLYDGPYLLHEDNGGSPRDYIYLQGDPVAFVQSGSLYYIHNDYIGRPQVVTDGAQVVKWSRQNNAFGDVPGTDLIGGLNIGFPGQYYDVESGAYYNYYRTYDPATGRYLESDPIGLVAGLNTYAYVGNMPTTYVDPFGLDAVPAPVPLPIYILPVAFPGTPENDAFVDAVNGIINGLSDTGLGCPWYQAVCISDPMYNESSDDSESCPTPDSHPDEFDKLRGDQGYRPKDKKGKNERWKKDRLHGDHWDVSDKKGRKIKEIDFDGNQIWPGGPKNKNKK